MDRTLYRATLLVGLALGGLNAHAVEPFQEYRKRVEASQEIAAVKDDVFGDKVNLYNGQTDLTSVDISLPGNDSLPVQLVRRFPVEIHSQTAYVTQLGGAGGWDVDVPYISGMFGPISGWSAKRCSEEWVPKVTNFDLTEIWQGNTVHIPGESNRGMLAVEPGVPVPNDKAYRITTSERDVFDCIPMKSGLAGEGFRMRTTSGRLYYFDVAVDRFAGRMRRTQYSGEIYGTARSKVYLLASKVEDRFGNVVQYEYNEQGNPTRIIASDGRQISLFYANGQLDRATAAGRTWQYTYGAVEGYPRLTNVLLPDGSRWAYAYSNALRPPETSWDGNGGERCEEQPAELAVEYSMTVTHPSGAVATFDFNNQRHYRSGVHVSECQKRLAHGEDAEYGNLYWVLRTPHFFDVVSLQKKTVTGPGLSRPEVTSYTYGGPPQALWGKVTEAAAYPCADCPREKIVTVAHPDGTRTRYRYGFLYTANEGRVLGAELLDAGGDVVRREVTEYLGDGDASSQLFFERYGGIRSGEDPSTARVRPVIRRTIHQDGVAFSYSVNRHCGVGGTTYCFNEFARPGSETRSSSLGHSKVETTEYHEDKAQWVLGQVRRTLVNGVESSQTDYDPVTALPVRVYTFDKLKQALTYNADGTFASVSDGRDGLGGLDTTVRLFDWKRGTPQRIQYPATPDSPAGAQQSAVVNEDGSIAAVMDENGFRTCYQYDGGGRLRTILHPSEGSATAGQCDETTWNRTSIAFAPVNASEYGLAPNHWKQVVSTGNARSVTYYDAFWRPVVKEAYDTTDVAGTRSITVKRYDASGQLEFQSYPLSSLGTYADIALKGVRTQYDALDRPTVTMQDSELSSPIATRTEYLAGFKVRVTNALQQSTTTAFRVYDQPSTDLPISVGHPEGAYTDIERDQLDKPATLRRRNADGSLSVERRYVYHPNYRTLCKVIEPETGATVMNYDQAGNLAWTASGLMLPAVDVCNLDEGWISGRRVSRSYDARNRLLTLAFPDGRGNQEWSYTPDGKPARAKVYNGSGNTKAATTGYSYNRRRMITGERLQFGANDWTLSYGYNANGHQASVTHPGGEVVSYAPDAFGRPTQVASNVATYAEAVSYYPNGAIQGFSYGNGVIHAMIQNARQLPARSTDNGIVDLAYTYDSNGNTISIRDYVRGVSHDRSMTYDGLDRLLTATSPSFGGDGVHRYTYDVLDNLRSSKLLGVKDYADYYYEASSNRLTSIRNSSGAAVVGLEYDLQGNLKNKNGKLFDFDYGNRLRGVVNEEEYEYDAHGRRVLATSVDGQIRSIFGSDGVLRYQQDDRADKVFNHIYLGSSLIASRETAYSGASTVRYQHTDSLGSPVAVSNTLGQAAERTSFEPYGATLNKVIGGVGYAGHLMDAETALAYMQQRYYDPAIGRFLSVDPVTANGATRTYFNRYWYASNSPYVFTDPDGRAVERVEEGEIRGENTVVDLEPVVVRPARESTSAIVVHRTVSSSAASAINAAVKGKGARSFHLVIDTDGTTTQISNLDNVANHVGKPTGSVTNQNSIGIEIVGNYDQSTQTWDPLTPAQIEATAQAVHVIGEAYGTRMNVFPHESVSRKTAGEGGVVMQAIERRLNQIRINAAFPPPVDSSLQGYVP